MPVRLRSAMNCARIRLFILRCRCIERSTRKAKTKRPALCRFDSPSVACNCTDIERSSSNSATPCITLTWNSKAVPSLRSAMNCACIRLFILRCRSAERSTRRAKTKRPALCAGLFVLGYPNNFEPYIMRKKPNSSFFVIISDGTTFCHFYNSPKTNSCTIK